MLETDRLDANTELRVGVRAIAAATLCAALVLAAGAASAARVTDVRIGTHPGYARVVLETDAPADHEILAAPPVTPGEVVVRIGAASAARSLPARDGAPDVALEPQADGSTIARIRATGPVRVETQVLAAPPRLVLDLRRGAAPLPEPEPEPQLETAPEPPPVEATAPAPVAEVPPPIEAPAPPVVETPEPTPTDVEPPAPVEPPAEAEPEPVAAPPPLPIDMPKPPVVLPPVAAAPPPVATAFDPRSFGVGAALGIGLALVAWAARRERAAVVVEAPAAPPIASAPRHELPAEPLAPPIAALPAEPEPSLDALRGQRRIDDRLAAMADRLESIGERLARIEQGGEFQAAEIAAQRAAIARLQRALRAPPPPVRPARRTD